MNTNCPAKRVLCLLVAAIASSGALAADNKAPTLDDLLAAGQQAPKIEVPPVRQQLLRDAAFEAGVRYGRVARAREWRRLIEDRSMEFERIYRFGELTQPGGELPPVIETLKGRDGALAAKVTNNRMVLAGETYNVLIPSRLAATAPSWRQYVYQGLLTEVASTDLPDPALRPKSDAEKQIWDQAVRDGWESGRRLADQTLKTNLRHLDRDYFGQLQYVELVARGMMAPATVGADRALVAGDATQMSVDQTVINLEAPAALVPDARKWSNK